MRIPTIQALSTTLVLTLTACASSGPPRDTRVIDLERLDEVVLDDRAPFVIRIPKGTRLPVRVTVETPFVRTEDDAAPVIAVFERTVYWYPRQADMISFDGKTWQPFKDGHRGQLSFGLGKSAEGGVSGNVFVGLIPDD